MFRRNTLHYFIEKYRYLPENKPKMPELSNQEIFDDEGHINYDKVVEIVHLNLKNFLNAMLEESFILAKDEAYRAQLNETNSKIRDQALDAYLERKHIVSSEFYVELESRFYTTNSAIMGSLNNSQINNNSMDTILIELSLAINQLIARSVERHTDLIETLKLQLEELSFIAHQEFNIYCLHPQYFYSLIQDCITPLNISADGKILISKLLYQCISPNLSDFYLAMHNFLLEVNIEPVDDSRMNTTNKHDANSDNDNNSSSTSIMSMSTGQFYAPVEQELLQEFDNENDYVEKQLNRTPEIIDEVAMDIYGPGQTGLDDATVCLLLQPYSPNTKSDSSPAQRRQFIRALSSVQRIEAANNAIFQAKQIKTAVRRTLQEKGALDAIEIVENEEKIIDFVSNIFQVILKDESICDAIKAILARLQISTIKLALIDFTFFQNAKHPARQLLNKLTSIGINADSKQEQLFKKLNIIIKSITDDFETDVRIFELALTEINQLNTSNLAHKDPENKTEFNKHKHKSQRSAAKRVVIHTIKKFTKQKEISNQILEFCLKCWAPHMAYIYMDHGRNTKPWRDSVRTLRRIVEVAQSKHSLHEVSQYIHHPDTFFENIRKDLEFFEKRNDEFEDILEEAEVWYLTYLRKIEQEAEENDNNSSTQNSQINEPDSKQDNVIHLFKNLSPDTNQDEIPKLTEHVEQEDLYRDKNVTSDSDSVTSQETDHSDAIQEENESVEQNEIEDQEIPVSELDIESEFDENDIEEEPELNVTEHLPDSIVPGAWLEVYQGEDKAKRRLKFTKANTETNYLEFCDRSGDYSFEISLQTFLDDLSTGRSCLISENNRFDLALSSVINNIRTSQNDTDTK